MQHTVPAVAPTDDPGPPAVPEAPRSLRQRLEAIPKWAQLLYVTAVVAAALLIRVFLLESSYVIERSMEPTLHEGDRLLVYKPAYHGHPPRRGDIVLIDSGGEYFVKRVIAVGGDEIAVFGPQLWVNGVLFDEPYTEVDGEAVVQPERVPEGSVWVMGDNRPMSEDSRDWGAVPETALRGRIVLRYWPFAKFGPVR